MENKVERKNNKAKYILYIIFIIYILMLFKIVLFKYTSFSEILKGNLSFNFRSANLIPFKTISDFMEMKDRNLLRAFANIFGNIGVFAPIGYLLPLLFNKFNKVKKVIIVSIVLSLFFEGTQYFAYLGSLDIDDLILNTVGAIVGYYTYCVIKRFITNEKKINKASILLSIVSFIIAFAIAREEFGNMLGLTTHEVISIGEENIPKSDPNMFGTYLCKKENKIQMYKGIVYENSREKELLDTLTTEINDDTDFYYMHIEEGKNESTEMYKRISKEEFLKVESYSPIKIWNNELNSSLAKVIVVSKKIENVDTSYTVEDNSNKMISGTVEQLVDEGIVMNLSVTQELENGTSISTSGAGEHANLINIKFKNNTKFKLIKSKGNGDIIDTKECEKEALEVQDSVQLKGIKKGNDFIADYVEVYKIVE